MNLEPETLNVNYKLRPGKLQMATGNRQTCNM